MKAIIMAGGKGTRLKEIIKDEIPKPMAAVDGKPILEHQINRLRENGITDITIIVGHLKEKIIGHFKDGKAFGVKIGYIEENEPLGTAGALYYIKDKVKREAFLLVFGDLVFDFDVSRMCAFHEKTGAAVTLFAHPNSHPYDSDLIITDKTNKVLAFDSKSNTRNYVYKNLVNAGLYILNGLALDIITEPKKTDLERDVLPKLISGGSVYAYISTEFVKDAGTAERIAQIEAAMKKGIVKTRNLRNRQKCIFFDRDGTLNVYKGFITSHTDIELLDGAAETVRAVNESGYLAIMVSNQPVVARGECTMEEVEKANDYLNMLLGKHGAYLDDMLFCPHHTDKGFAGERPELKFDCNCRKPKTGMVDFFIEKYNISREASYIVGDDDRDILTGKNAALKTVRLGNNGNVEADFHIDKLIGLVEIIREAK